jgi:hypothetical protein
LPGEDAGLSMSVEGFDQLRAVHFAGGLAGGNQDLHAVIVR